MQLQLGIFSTKFYKISYVCCFKSSVVEIITFSYFVIMTRFGDLCVTGNNHWVLATSACLHNRLLFLIFWYIGSLRILQILMADNDVKVALDQRPVFFLLNSTMVKWSDYLFS